MTLTGPLVLDTFAGPGGWDEGLRLLGYPGLVVGIEWDAAACETRAAAGHLTIRADVARYPTAPFVGRVSGLIASPPCPTFSMAGKGAGRREIDRLLGHVAACRDGWVEPDPPETWEDARTPLILQVLRWVWDLKPDWVACEQVPACLPLWEAMLDVLSGWGYDGWADVLCAADYGVPQTRRRAFLAASRTGKARRPEPTHSDQRKAGDLFGLLPWVSMAEALGWGYDERPSPTVTGGGGATGGAEPFGHAARKALSGWVLTERQAHGVSRRLDEPAMTITASADNGNFRWAFEGPAPTIVTTRRSKDGMIVGRQLPEGEGVNVGGRNWVGERPATTVQGDPRIAPPGHRDRAGGESQFGNAVRVTVEEAAVLQGFRRDYPWRGTKTKQHEQVGNAVPPPLAAAVLVGLVPPSGVSGVQRETGEAA